MAFFDKLKEIKQTFTDVKAGIQKGINELNMSDEERVALLAEQQAAEISAMIDASSLSYLPCKDFELEEVEGCPEEYRITEYVGFGVKGNIEIPAEIDGKKVVAVGKRLFLNSKELQYVKIAEGIKVIESDAFRESSLKGIFLPDSLERVGACVFAKSELQSIIFPENVSFIGRACFYRCTQLLTAKLPASKQSLPDYLFCGCTKLKEVVLPHNLVSVGHDANVPCAAFPSSLECLGNQGLLLPHYEELHFPEKLRQVHNKLFKNLNCDKLYIPAGIKLIQTGECYDEEDPFEKDFGLDEKETDLEDDAWKLSFEGANYKEIVFAPMSEYGLSGVDGPFRDCKKLEKLYIPRTMTEFDKLYGLFGKHETHKSFVATKDQYGRAVYDHDGRAMGHFTGKDSSTILPPPNPDFVLYCEAGSAALKFARQFEIACEEWIY